MEKNKKIFYTLLFVMLFSAFNLIGQTTQEEYNYITKGYKTQVESGLDMKKGYNLINLGSSSLSIGNEKRVTEFKGLVKDGQTKPCAIMMIYKRTDISNGAVYYICIPSTDASKDIWQQTLDFISSNIKDNNAMSQVIIWGLMKFGSQEASK